MRTKHTFRLPPELAKQLSDYAHRKRLHQAFVVETALTSFLSPDNSERMEAALGKRLDRLTRQVERLERDIDGLNATLAPLTSFVLPGGTPAAAHLHMARTICRRAERIMVELAAKPGEPVSDAAIQYMNRLSDFLFVASRAANHNGAGDVLWVPGQNR